MLIHHARRRARFAAGELVLLEDQDRTLWDQASIGAGRHALDRAIALRGRGPYVLQAAIASLYAEAPSYDQTDWPQIVALYDVLRTLWPGSPVVTLNRAAAIGFLAFA